MRESMLAKAWLKRGQCASFFAISKEFFTSLATISYIKGYRDSIIETLRVAHIGWTLRTMRRSRVFTRFWSIIKMITGFVLYFKIYRPLSNHFFNFGNTMKSSILEQKNEAWVQRTKIDSEMDKGAFCQENQKLWIYLIWELSYNSGRYFLEN